MLRAPRRLPTTFVFVSLLGLSAAGCGADAQVVRPVYPVERVVVVGAGMAGITTAHALEAAGYETVVLEARDRIGGRIHTVDVGGVPLDVGAAWLHGSAENPLVDVAHAYGLTTIPDDVEDIALAASETHGAYTDAELVEASELADSFFPALPGLRRTLGSDASVEDGIETYVAGLSTSARVSSLVSGLLGRSYFELDYAAPIGLQSLRWADEDGALVGGDRLIVGGYGPLVDRLAMGLDVRLGQAVTAIAYDATGVRVTTATETFTGSHVVVTVPRNLLRDGAIVFDPPLPAEKTAALARLDQANLEKVVLRFPSVFWDDLVDDTGLYLADEPGAMPGFFDLTAEAGAPTLVVLYGGSYARDAQATLDDAALVAAALDHLGALLDLSVPTPTATYVTHWTTDPYARGSYGYIPVGASPDDVDLYAAPVADRVFFAGEGTDFDVGSTVHAAFLSGIRVARRLGVSDPGIPGY